jgi:ribonuclease HII
MRRAVQGLSCRPQQVLVDGNRLPPLLGLCDNARAVVRGDATVPAISAASILAKCARDQLMQSLDLVYPGYGLAQHKGYPTAAHLAALREHGPLPLHRLSFAPVRALVR